MNYYVNYNSSVDIATLFLILVFYLIFKYTFYNNSKKNKVFKIASVCLFAATLFNIFYMMFISYTDPSYSIVIYILRNIANFLLLICFNIFIGYLTLMFEKNKTSATIIHIIGFILLISSSVMMILSPITKIGFYITEAGISKGNFFIDPFAFAYITYYFILFILLLKYKKNMFNRAFYAILGSYFLSLTMSVYESVNSSSTFVCFTFMIPIVTVYALFHSNSYKIETGTLDQAAFSDYLVELNQKGKNFGLVSLLFVGDKNIDKFLIDIHEELMHFYDKYFKQAYTFRVSDRRFVLIYQKSKLIDEDKFKEFKDEFNKLYDEYQIAFKLVIVPSNSILEQNKKYLEYVRYLENRQKINCYYQSTNRNLAEFLNEQEVIHELEDINKEKNLDDERVIPYIQPIYDTKNKKILTGEALMRLNLPNEGLIYPDSFIEVAERNGFIHILSLIMLNKICKNLKEFIKEGYDIERISVNFSSQELSNPKFGREVESIIKKNGIPFNMIGIEITESQEIEEQESIIERVKYLSDLGIKIYLDDFGTGYSNFERIMKLPFDVIKFDKSLLDNANMDDKFKIMTKNLADTYRKLGYEILFEGIETDKDISLCANEMHARYLQGYIYSKPIPIKEFTNFIEKK